MRSKQGAFGELQYDPIDQRLPSLGKVWIKDGELAGLIGDVISLRNLTSLSSANEINDNGLDRNCLVVRLLPDCERKGYSYIRHYLEGAVEYINEETAE